MRNLASFKTLLNFESPAQISEFWNKSAMLRWSLYVLAKFGEVGSTHPWESSVSSDPTPEIARENALNRQQLSRGLFDFDQICKEFKRMTPEMLQKFKVKRSKSRSRRDITCVKIRKIINNSAMDCLISLKFRTYFDHVTLDVPRTFKINRSKVKVAAWHNVPASENAKIQPRIFEGQTWWKLSKSRAQHFRHVQGHKVKHWNRKQ